MRELIRSECAVVAGGSGVAGIVGSISPAVLGAATEVATLTADGFSYFDVLGQWCYTDTHRAVFICTE